MGHVPAKLVFSAANLPSVAMAEPGLGNRLIKCSGSLARQLSDPPVLRPRTVISVLVEDSGWFSEPPRIWMAMEGRDHVKEKYVLDGMKCVLRMLGAGSGLLPDPSKGWDFGI